MMKKISAFLLAVLMAFGACLPTWAEEPPLLGLGSGNPGASDGSDGQTEEEPAFQLPEELDTTRNFELTFWAKNDTNKNQTDVYDKAVKDFHKYYPNITVKIKQYTDYARIYDDVITNIATDTTPNVCITYPDHIATYLTGKDTMVNLDSLITDKNYGMGGSKIKFDSVPFDQMVPEFMEECRVSGSFYALPFMRSTEACYVNKTYVEAMGYTLPDVLTWDFIWEVSDAAMAKNADGKTFKVNGQEVLIPFIYKSTDNMMISMLKQLDAPYSTAEGDILIFNNTTRDLLYEIAKHAQTRSFSTFKISSYPANFLDAGQCIFAIDSTAGATWMGSSAPLSDIDLSQRVDFETVVLPIPQFDPAHPQMISQGPSVCVFNKEDPQEVLAAWLFAQFLLTDDVQMGYAETEGYAPVTKRAQQNPAYLDYLSRSGEDNNRYYSIKIDATKLLMDNTENTFVTPVFNGSASLRTAAGQLIEEVVKSIRRKETVNDKYMRELYARIKTLYRLDKGTELGPLPPTAKALLISLAAVWVVIGGFFFAGLIKKKKVIN